MEAAPGAGGLAERVDASAWRVELPGVEPAVAAAAAGAFLARESVEVERLTKDGRRSVDARGPVVSLLVGAPAERPRGALCDT